ncbi:MAG: hypothetical protein KOO60_02850 [Gemmatimonadales bacterium]|nr:hypothetical protein [Gemmatimonadales bacterium]
MRFFTDPHQNYCGIDLHARSMYLCVQNREGKIVFHRNMQARPVISKSHPRVSLPKIQTPQKNTQPGAAVATTLSSQFLKPLSELTVIIASTGVSTR